MRYMPSGRPVTSFSVGATRSWRDTQGEKHEETEWFNVVAWGEMAERCKGDLEKNDRIYVEGRLQTRSWTTDDGSSRFRAELVATEMILLNRANEAEGTVTGAANE
jgi:single-strand DNA-binding protein